MALDQKDFLLSEARVIRNETDDGKNTAERVGKALVDIINAVDAMGSASDGDVASEAAARAAADATLQSNISAEAQLRQSTDTALQGNINSEAAARQSADTALQSGLASEASARESADTALQSGISKEATDRQAAVSAEAAERESADLQLQTGIDLEAEARGQADDELQGFITQETTEREEADRQINARVDSMALDVYPIDIEVGVSHDLKEHDPHGEPFVFSGTITRKGVPVPDDDIELIDFTVNGGEPYGIEAVADVNHTIVLSDYGDYEVVMRVMAYGSVYTKTFRLTLELPMRFGFSEAASVAELDIDDLQEQPLARDPKGDRSLVNEEDGSYLWLCVPKRMSISLVTSSCVKVPMEAPAESGEYKCYRSSAAILAGTMGITIQ